jgi:nucleotide-binding universal stress UspA family protein
MLYKTLLCATDGYSHADRAVRYAGTIAGEAGAALPVVHVSESPAAAGLLPGDEAWLNPARRRQRITTR